MIKDRVKAHNKHARNERDLEKELKKLDKERERCEREYKKEMSKIDNDRQRDDKEEKGVRKVLWILGRLEYGLRWESTRGR